MKYTLEKYLEGATHYLFPDQRLDGPARQRRQIINFCKAHGLDQKFRELVTNDSKWRQLAQKQKVYFFEDVVKRPERFHGKLPTIELLCTEGGTCPVIKVLISSHMVWDSYLER